MKVLSIDFDYIMYPCIKLYNNKCFGNENATVIWNRIEYELEIEKFLNYDANSLSELFNLLKRVSENDNVEILPIEEHQEIIKYLPDDEKISLVNIDFHHDIWYHDDTESMKNFDEYNCSNWVGYLMLKDRIESYTWVKAPNSVPFVNQTKNKIKYSELGKKDICNLNDFDKVFICFSPQWTPYKFRHLYDIMVDMFATNK